MSAQLTIVIPCYNEELAITKVIEEYRCEFPEAKIVVVDNASTDLTATKAADAGATVLSEKRQGKARAMLKAFQDVHSDLILMVDGDGSYPAEGARLLLEEYGRFPVDMITGVRSSDGKDEIFRPLHQRGTRCFASCIQFLFGYKAGDVFSGMRLFTRRFYKNVPILSRGFELEIELTIQTIDKSFDSSELIIPFRKREIGSNSKLKTISDGLRILRNLVLLFRDYKPLTFFGFFATFFFTFGLLSGAPPIYEYYLTHQVGRFPLAILAAALMNLSALTLLIGLMSETSLRYHREAFQIKLRNSV